MSWTPEKVEKLKELWGKGNTASEIAQILGGVTRNAVIGKAHRLNLSGKIQTKKSSSLATNNNDNENKISRKNLRRGKFKSLIIDKDFEPENPKQLEELDENSCKWPIGHPNEDNFYFCGRTSLKDFSYCKLHLLYAFQPKNRKEDVLDKDKDNEVPKFIRKKDKVSLNYSPNIFFLAAINSSSLRIFFSCNSFNSLSFLIKSS